MARKKICVLCGQPIEDDSKSVPYKGRHAHQECFNRTMKIVTNEKKKELQDKSKENKSKPKVKVQKELKDGLSEEEYKQKTDLMNLIRQIQGTDKLTAKTYALIDKLYAQDKYSYGDIKKAVYWRYEIAVDKKWQRTEDIAGGIRYYIDEALRYFKFVESTNLYNKSIVSQDLYKTKVVKIKLPQVNVPQIDITEIGE